MPPHISVVLVSDYGSGPHAEAELRDVLRALARQDIGQPFEVVLVHENGCASLADERPGVRLLLSSAAGSYTRKNEGVAAASGEWVALLDGDCAPTSEWLRSLADSIQAGGERAAYSGPTYYAGADLTSRVLSLLARGYLDPGEDGETRYIANNNCIMRRDVYLSCPLPESAGAFSAHMQSEALRRRGHRFGFTQGAAVTHAFDGWAMERDLRRNTGYITIRGRRIDPSLQYTWLLKLGWACLPLFAAGKLLHRLSDLIRCRRRYGIGWHELPAAALLTFYVQALEVPGMARALSRRPLGPSEWR